MDEGLILLLVGAILLASIVVALFASRTGVPTLVAFLALGMLLGSDGPGGIAFDDAELAPSVGVMGLCAILYEGGLSTSWRRLRQVVVPAALLSTVGVVVTALLTGAAAYALFALSWRAAGGRGAGPAPRPRHVLRRRAHALRVAAAARWRALRAAREGRAPRMVERSPARSAAGLSSP